MDRQNGMLQLTRAEVELAALAVGFRPGTIRQWFHRRSIPARAQLKIIESIGRPFMVNEWPTGTNATLKRSCLADLARTYIRP